MAKGNKFTGGGNHKMNTAMRQVQAMQEEMTRMQAELEELLIPRDPADDKPAIIEIRAGAGGDEASLFAGELYRLYTKYAENHGLRVELISQNENEAGGMKEIIFKIKYILIILVNFKRLLRHKLYICISIRISE